MEISANTATIIAALVSLVVTGIFIHFGASFVVPGKQQVMQGIAVAFFGNLLAALVLLGAGGFGRLGALLALAAWALVAAIIYRTSWLRGAAVGLAAWLLWLLVQWLLSNVL